MSSLSASDERQFISPCIDAGSEHRSDMLVYRVNRNFYITVIDDSNTNTRGGLSVFVQFIRFELLMLDCNNMPSIPFRNTCLCDKDIPCIEM